MKFARCDIPIFNCSVLAVVDCDEVEGIKYLIEYAEGLEVITPDLDITHNAKGWCQSTGNDCYLWVNKEEYSVVFHEVVHAAFQLCEIIGADIEEEIIARLVEYLKVNLVDKLEDIK